MSQPCKFTDNSGSFTNPSADKIKTLYFPLCNEALLSSISPDLHGDIESGQNSFLMPPVSRIDLINSKASRNFWVYVNKDKIWSATGVSKGLKQIQEDRFFLEAGLLWHKISRENKKIGLKSEILSFVPYSGEPVEIMQVILTNITGRSIEFIPTAAIPMYARGANNIRDHRHVTSLLQRIILHKYGVISKPTLSFDETGHRPNKNYYFVLGWDNQGRAPEYLYPTQEMFCQDSGDLEAPESVLKNILPAKESIQGKEVMGGLRFIQAVLAPEKSYTYTVIMGITPGLKDINSLINKFKASKQVRASLNKTKTFWTDKANKISIKSGDNNFDNWFKWVAIQPTLRKIFGCSFLPDFDYGKGGRGWRDLWQDCLGLILSGSQEARETLINNFSGVRIDGSNATIICKGEGEYTPHLLGSKRLNKIEGAGFIADRNNISRVWMDHGIWPLLTLDLYVNESGDFDILFEQAGYFCDQHIRRSRETDADWSVDFGNKLKVSSGKVYQGTLFEHLLIQNLTQFFNVGTHNHIRLEGADWNDGLDMAQEFGESVAFSAMYAKNLSRLAELLLKSGKKEIEIAKEMKVLLKRVDYNNIKAKQKVLEEYFGQAKCVISGHKIKVKAEELARNLKIKSAWIARHIQKEEWLKQGFFNGYYDNNKERAEGIKGSVLRMMLASQVFPILSGVANQKQVTRAVKNVEKYLFDKKLGGYRLNTDFRKEQYALGRAFSFIYGDKENGAIFSHMVVMYAYALYSRGLVNQGWRALNSLYKLAVNSERAKIYPCLPEYFNSEGRGMYSYLTGSASWFILTLVTQSFGLRGEAGDLLIEPKLAKQQFQGSSSIGITRNFSGRRLQINFINPRKLEYGKYKIISLKINSGELPAVKESHFVISRKVILALPANRLNTVDIVLD
ncbi:MAG: cellobiose phosphorylase [Candidatus Omnitrophica bacterium CG08_land_8_20_14_0_20_41_16]|uniref:Cellobiose phosphorylase n=1 Tax=Candidatus Sherwoodlollariibacterium unditelluris TaxID=1974757 RepID=A0A2G9YIK0_9BACT|nr:MAG: cellobiose phosphorylase [Candidatus Omnitrophica bacterium CG23_combo_of_CG06-09_8_20_14_all_41_10]PIS33375.1 MAG: cellobiose phosphorylase [Candidatus Omnitrophica bacterium CG08_land_8_20_14_0_20_41_16]